MPLRSASIHIERVQQGEPRLLARHIVRVASVHFETFHLQPVDICLPHARLRPCMVVYATSWGVEVPVKLLSC
jgi:hypothetical protein